MATISQASFPAETLAPSFVPVEQVQELLKLQRAAQKINSILDLDQLIDQIVNDIALSFGCLETNIYLHEEEQAELVLAGVKGCTLYGKGHRMKLGKEGMVGYVAATRQMRYAPDVRQDPYYSCCEQSVLSEVAIPLQVGPHLVGVFMASHPELNAFPPEQLRILQALCSHIAVAVHNARLFQRERQQKESLDREAQEARAIQQALFPKSSPFIPGFAVTGFSIPAGAVGGDWYDFLPLDGGLWGLVLADVSGKGMPAALLMSSTRGMVRSLAQACCTPSEVLARLNQLMVADFPSGKFVTLIYAVLDPANRTLTFANAGHLPPLLVTGEEARFLPSETGLPLGLRCGSFSETRVDLPENSRLVFYSDGITEAENQNGEEYGVARLEKHLRGLEACPESILHDVHSFVNGTGLSDDASVIMIRA